MAVSADHVLHLTAGLFGLAPSRAITNDLTNAANVSVLAAQLGNAQFTKDFYPVFNDAKAAKLADILLGNSVSAETKTAAVGALQGMLDANGGNVGSAALSGIEFLLSTSDTNFAAAKTQLQNRVEVAKAYVNSKNPTSNLQLTNVTQEAATKTAAIAAIDAPASKSFNLTTGLDNLIGTEANDTFTADFNGNNNTFESGDAVDGGAGTDTLSLNLGNASNFAINATTKSVENVVIRAQSIDTNGSSSDNNITTNQVTVDADRMNGVNYWENSNSRADLVVEDVRILPGQITKDITIAMVETDPGHVDFGFYFDQYSLRNVSSSTSTLRLELLDTRAKVAGQDPLKDNPYWGFTFKLNGTNQTIASDAIDAAQTYEQLLVAVNEAIAANTALAGKVTAALGNNFTRVDTLSGTAVVGTELVISSVAGNTISVDATNGWQTKNGVVPPSSGLHTDMNTATTTSSELVTSKIILDDVGRGSTGGDLVVGGLSVGDTSSSKGVQRFEIEVRDNSKLQHISSTNNTLREVTIVNGATSSSSHAYVETVKDAGNLTVNGNAGVNGTNTGVTVGGINTPLPGSTDQHGEYGFSDVRLIDASTFKGKLEFDAEITDKSIAKYLNLKDQAANLPAADNVAFVYTGGANNDTMTVLVDSKVAASNTLSGREDFTFAINGGAGDDNITLDIGGNETGPWYADQKMLKNISVTGGDGNDTIRTPGAGDVNIDAGAGNDTVYADNTGKIDATWIVAAENTDLADLQGSRTGTGNTFLYKGTVTVTFTGSGADAGGAVTAGNAAALTNGWEVTVDIPTGNNYTVNQWHVNQAIKKAINDNPVLSKLLVAQDGPANTLVIDSLIDGNFNAKDLLIEVKGKDLTALSSGEQATVLTAYKAFASNSAATITDANNAETASQTALNGVKGMGANQVIHAANGTLSAAESDNTINLGSGDDVVVLGSGANSNDTIVFTGYELGKKTIVNFESVAGNDADYLDFSSYLTGKFSTSGSNESQQPIAITLNADNLVEANSITVLAPTFTTTDNFAGLTAGKLLAAINSTNTGSANFAGITSGTLDAANIYTTSTPVTLVGGVGKSVVLIENSANKGEYKAFELTFNGTSTNTARDFTEAKLIATFDVGASVASFANAFGKASSIPGGTGTGTGTGGSTTDAKTISAAGTTTDGGNTVNTTYTIQSGTYTHTINGFNDGDVLKLFPGYSATVMPDADDTDGIQDIQFADSATGNTVTIKLAGLSAADDAALFSQASINTVFGAGTLA